MKPPGVVRGAPPSRRPSFFCSIALVGIVKAQRVPRSFSAGDEKGDSRWQAFKRPLRSFEAEVCVSRAAADGGSPETPSDPESAFPHRSAAESSASATHPAWAVLGHRGATSRESRRPLRFRRAPPRPRSAWLRARRPPSRRRTSRRRAAVDATTARASGRRSGHHPSLGSTHDGYLEVSCASSRQRPHSPRLPQSFDALSPVGPRTVRIVGCRGGRRR